MRRTGGRADTRLATGRSAPPAKATLVQNGAPFVELHHRRARPRTPEERDPRRRPRSQSVYYELLDTIIQHGGVELSPKTAKDAHGAPAQPYRAVDTIEIMLRVTIDKEMTNAADCFRRAFRIAHYGPAASG